jgi:hypothetical protein
MTQDNIQRFHKYEECPVCRSKVSQREFYCANPECGFRLKYTHENIDPLNVEIEEIRVSLHEAGFQVEELSQEHDTDKILFVDDEELQASFFVGIQKMGEDLALLQIFFDYEVKKNKDELNFYKTLNKSNQLTDPQVTFIYDEEEKDLSIYSTIFLYAPIPTSQLVMFFKIRILNIMRSIVESGLHHYLK